MSETKNHQDESIQCQKPDPDIFEIVLTAINSTAAIITITGAVVAAFDRLKNGGKHIEEVDHLFENYKFVLSNLFLLVEENEQGFADKPVSVQNMGFGIDKHKYAVYLDLKRNLRVISNSLVEIQNEVEGAIVKKGVAVEPSKQCFEISQEIEGILASWGDESFTFRKLVVRLKSINRKIESLLRNEHQRG